MIACPLCGAELREDSRFCDKCGAQLPRRGFPQAGYAYAPIIPMPVALGPDLVQQALMYLNQLDLQQKTEVLYLAWQATRGALWAKQRLREWLEWRRIRDRLDQRRWQ